MMNNYRKPPSPSSCSKTKVMNKTNGTRCNTAKRIHKNVPDDIDDDAITLAETVVHDHDDNNNNNCDTMITIINNVDSDNKEGDDSFVQEFIRENIVQDMNDLAFVYMILTKCKNCNVFTERQIYSYTVQALLQALTIIDSTAARTEASSTDDERSITQEDNKEEDIFNTIIDLVMEQEQLFSNEYKDSDELKTFLRITLQNRSNEQPKEREEGKGGKFLKRATKEELRNKVDRMEEYLNYRMKQSNDENNTDVKTCTFRIRAFCGIASLFLNSMASKYCSDNCNGNNNNDSDIIFSSLKQMLSEKAPLELPPLFKVTNFGDKEQISRGIEGCLFGNEETLGDVVQSSIDYVNNLDLSWLLGDEDAVSTIANSFLMKNRDKDGDNNFQMQVSTSIIETIVKLQVTMINVNLVQLDEQSNDINSIVKTMTDHPCIASIQERGCEKLANFSASDTISYEESQAAANAVVDAMNRHEDISNVQSFGVAAMISLRAAMLPKDNVANITNDRSHQATCFSKILKLCCLEFS